MEHAVLMPKIQVLIQRRDGSQDVEFFHTAQVAESFCREEVKWESTARVICDRIGFDETGDFA